MSLRSLLVSNPVTDGDICGYFNTPGFAVILPLVTVGLVEPVVALARSTRW